MNYPVIDPVGAGTNIKLLIKNSGNTIAAESFLSLTIPDSLMRRMTMMSRTLPNS